eukprot:SM000126S26326  [mRNA]  locus=s126:198035:200532:+ [translate_table: standard]
MVPRWPRMTWRRRPGLRTILLVVAIVAAAVPQALAKQLHRRASLTADLSPPSLPPPASPPPPSAGGSSGGIPPRPPLDANTCDLLTGKWVVDPARPVYNSSCPFIDPSLNCVANGRPDRDFERYSWRPHGCTLPRFDPLAFLQLARNKTIAIVGDSIAKWNLYTSIMCQIHQVATTVKTKNKLPISKVKDYTVPAFGVRVICIFAQFLVSAATSDTKVYTNLGDLYPTEQKFIVDVKKPSSTWSTYLDIFDILVLESGWWWQGERVFVDSSSTLIPGATYQSAYRTALKTVRDYVQEESKWSGIPFLMTVPADHPFSPFRAPPGSTCGALGPINDKKVRLLASQTQALRDYLPVESSVFEDSSFRILDTAYQSAYRPDGHPGIWSVAGGVSSTNASDCLHYCTPGVPDIWVDMFLALLLREPTLNPGGVYGRVFQRKSKKGHKM